MFGSPFFKEWSGEATVRFASWMMLDNDVYHPIHNIMLATPDGTTQIDHIFVSIYGIFIIETKNMKGWIFGSPNQKTWTQVTFTGKYKFQNPIRQNYKHTQAIKKLLNLREEIIIPVVVFIGDCEFKTQMPENVIKGTRFTKYIKEKQIIRMSTYQVDECISKIKSGNMSTWRTRREHEVRLKSRSNEESEQLCPRCGKKMILRTNRSSGEKFWGCSGYPECKATRQIST